MVLIHNCESYDAVTGWDGRTDDATYVPNYFINKGSLPDHGTLTTVPTVH